MKHIFAKPYTFEGKEYKEIELDLDSLTGNDYLLAERQFGEHFNNKVTPLPELSKEYQMIIAARASNQPLEFYMQMPIKEVSKITIKIQNFLLSEDSETTLDKA